MTMGGVGRGATKFIALLLVLITAIAISTTVAIRGLIADVEHSNHILRYSSAAQANLQQMRLLDFELRSGVPVDAVEYDRLRSQFSINASAVADTLAPTERQATNEAIERFLLLTPADASFETTSTQATITQGRFDAIETRLDAIEKDALLQAQRSSGRAQTGTLLAGVGSLVGIASLILIGFDRNRRQLTTALRERYNDRFHSIIEQSDDYLFVIEDDGAVSYASPAVGRTLTDRRIDHIDQIFTMMRGEDVRLIRAALANPDLATPMVFPVQLPNGTFRQVEMTLTDHRESAAIRALVVSGRDVTSQVAMQEQLQELANCDELTQLPNRRAMNQAIEAALVRQTRTAGVCGLLLLDLDGFKGVNDALGHPVGDKLLREVADRLRNGSRGGELVGRIGGDEFAVVLEGLTSLSAAHVSANRLANLLKTPFEIDGQLLALGVSGGLVGGDSGVTDGIEMFRKADIALYEAKNKGRGIVLKFEDEMEALLDSRTRLQREVENGHRNGEFSLEYQPLLTVDGQQTVGFEALMRWNSPVLGSVSPMTFIPVCEGTGLIVELGRWALEEACSKLAEWQRQFGEPRLSMSVNVSVVQLSDRSFVDNVIKTLELTGIAPQTLQLEVTESVIADSIEDLISKLEQIRSLGVRVALDDFGTGYSSMGQLQSLPVDCIKIDRSFIEALRNGGDDEEERAGLVVGALVDLGRALGMQVVAEGVEEFDQLQALIGPQCDLAQGYLLARPMTATQVVEYMLTDTASDAKFPGPSL